MENKDRYLAVCTFYERTHHSIPISREGLVKFEASKEENPESELEKTLNSHYFSKPNHKITEVKPSIIYKISEEITPKKISYETPLKKMYGSE